MGVRVRNAIPPAPLPENLSTHAHQDYPEAAQALKDGKLDAFGKLVRNGLPRTGPPLQTAMTNRGIPRVLFDTAGK